MKYIKLFEQEYSIYEIIIMTPENAGKVLYDECMKESPDMELIKNILELSPVDVNLQDKGGYTALMWASWKGRTEIVKLLLERPEILVNLQNEWGLTALMLASGHRKIENLIKDHPNFNRDA